MLLKTFVVGLQYVSVLEKYCQCIYRFSSDGLYCWVVRKLYRNTGMYIFAIMGLKAAPIAVPLVCWKVDSPNLKQLWLMFRWSRCIMKSGFKSMSSFGHRLC